MCYPLPCTALEDISHADTTSHQPLLGCAVKSAFSEAGTGSFWSQQRDTNGHHSDRSTNLENLNSDDMIAGNSITGSVGGARERRPLHCPM